MSDGAPYLATTEERTNALHHAIAGEVGRGWRVQTQTPTTAQLVKGHRTNHVLHLILTILTVGLWGIVWICMVVFGGEKHEYLEVNEAGRVIKR